MGTPWPPPRIWSRASISGGKQKKQKQETNKKLYDSYDSYDSATQHVRTAGLRAVDWKKIVQSVYCIPITFSVVIQFGIYQSSFNPGYKHKNEHVTAHTVHWFFDGQAAQWGPGMPPPEDMVQSQYKWRGKKKKTVNKTRTNVTEKNDKNVVNIK